jgi:hypothetical protein
MAILSLPAGPPALLGGCPATGVIAESKPIGHLARQARIAGALLEINEKWACPSVRTVQAFADAG